MDNVAKIVLDQHDLPGLEGHICPRPNGDPKICCRKRRSVVDAIADESNSFSPSLQLLHFICFVFREDFRENIADADLSGYRIGGALAISCNHGSMNTELFKTADRIRSVVFHRVGHSNQSCRSISDPDDHDGLAFMLETFEVSIKLHNIDMLSIEESP